MLSCGCGPSCSMLTSWAPGISRSSSTVCRARSSRTSESGPENSAARGADVDDSLVHVRQELDAEAGRHFRADDDEEAEDHRHHQPAGREERPDRPSVSWSQNREERVLPLLVAAAEEESREDRNDEEGE